MAVAALRTESSARMIGTFPLRFPVMPHLFVDISAHGFGHLAQTAPVLEALADLLPDLRLTIRTGLPLTQLQQRIAHLFSHIEAASDVSFLMHDAVRVDRDASAAAYRNCHADWPARVAREADELERMAPDLVLANISALPLAGAQRAGLPAIALCSLNWADQFAFLFAGTDWADPIRRQLHEAYAGADFFLRCVPAAPMPALANVRDLPPIARTGQSDRAVLAGRLGVRSGQRMVLVGMGGIDFALPIAHWPCNDELLWLVREPLPVARPDVVCYRDLGWHFSDVLASVDAVVTKPGYGMFVESAAVGTPVLFLRREDWPEQDALIDWLCREAVCGEIDAASFERGDLHAALHRLWRAPRRRVAANGAAAAAAILAEKLRPGRRSA